MKYYRFVCNGQDGMKGIYAQVDIDCPRDSVLRTNKPDGSWLPKVGPDYKGAISFFTPVGLKKYRESGLSRWHASVVSGEVEILIGSNPQNILHEDEFQIILMEEDIETG